MRLNRGTDRLPALAKQDATYYNWRSESVTGAVPLTDVGGWSGQPGVRPAGDLRQRPGIEAVIRLHRMSNLTGPVDPGATSAAELLQSLVLTPHADDHFVARSVSTNPSHLFGGQVLAQSLMAAAQTVADAKTAHSMHAYFLRAGDPSTPIDYVVHRVRDGRRLSCRSVSARQDGREIATALCSFGATTGSVSHSTTIPNDSPPETVPTLTENARAWGGLGQAWRGFEALEIRLSPRPTVSSDGLVPTDDAGDDIWMRMTAPLPDDQLLHQSLLAYSSDITLLAAGLVPHGIPIGMDRAASMRWEGVSLDHAIWFHRPVRVDDWFLFAQESPIASQGRALSRAQVFSADGELVASAAQEGLLTDLRR